MERLSAEYPLPECVVVSLESFWDLPGQVSAALLPCFPPKGSDEKEATQCFCHQLLAWATAG